MIQELLVINYPDFVRHAWVSSCIYWAILSIGYIANVWGYRVLPMIEKLAMVLHIAFFFVIFIVALVLPPERKSAAFVFTTFINRSGWKEDGIAWLLGLLTSSYVMVGK
jgi:choline transport protein